MISNKLADVLGIAIGLLIALWIGAILLTPIFLIGWALGLR